MAEGQLDELAHAVGLAGGQHVIVGLILLQDAPHALDIVARMAPVALGVQVAEIQAVLPAMLDGGDRAGDLAGDEGLAAGRTLVVEQDAVAGMHAVGLAVVHRDPVGVQLGGGIGAARVEGRGLALRRLLHLAVQFRGGGLIEARGLLHAQDPDRLQQAQGADAVGVGGVFRRLEAHMHVALGSQIVDLGRLDLLDQTDQVGAVGQVAVMHEEAHVLLMRVAVEMLHAPRVEGRGPALDAMDDIALPQQKLGEIRAILAGGAGDEGNFAQRTDP